MQKDSVEFGESWSSLCYMVPKFSDIPSLVDEFIEIDATGYREWSSFRSHKELHIDLCPAEVEAIEGMTFSPSATLDQAPSLFAHEVGSTTTKIRGESSKLFGRLATSSFIAFSHCLCENKL
ncbi:hypothetical protein F444_09333 [Phytophthora nicotianae P1976]|uniref:Uncharacterized protein n=1 Tax=Phytophthora nicotianae P1976 TaxID=1317066 RepID=A0A081A819_PHYNI|nr:hypothetical protein F444_09333 [Phytophthora nicotianae P1976]